MLLTEAWQIYAADKQIEGFSPHTLKGYKIQHNLLVRYFGDIDIETVTLPDLKRYLVDTGSHLKPSSTRWSVGDVADLGLNSTNFYYENVLSAVQKVAAAWKGELRFRVVVTGGVISARYVDLLARRGADTGKQFAYGRHIEHIEREVDLTNVATALYGRGKGVEVGEGYGRRLDFGDIVWSTSNGDPVDKPAGQKWVGDPEALARWGRPGGRHRFGVYEDPEETDPVKLLQKTWEDLQERKNPRVTYRLDVVDLERLSGYEHEKLSGRRA